MMTAPSTDPSGAALLAACEQAGIPNVRFNTGETVVNGAGLFQGNRQPDGTRASSSVSYLHPILEQQNLTVLTDVHVPELEFDGDRLRRRPVRRQCLRAA